MASFALRKLLLACLASLLLHLALVLPFWYASEAPGDARPLGIVSGRGAPGQLEATIGMRRPRPTPPAESGAPVSRHDGPLSSPASRTVEIAQPLEFFAIDRLDSAPCPNEAIDLASGAVQKRGKIELEVKVGEHGEVLGVTAINSEFGDDDTEWIEKTLRRTSFQPGMRRGEAVNSIVRMEISVSGSE